MLQVPVASNNNLLKRNTVRSFDTENDKTLSVTF